MNDDKRTVILAEQLEEHPSLSISIDVYAKDARMTTLYPF